MSNELTDMASNTLFAGWEVFSAWVFTPTGALLTLLLIGLGIANGALSFMGRTTRILKYALGIVATVWLLWVLGGVLGRMGAPIREVFTLIFAWLPPLMNAFMGFLQRLFETAG